MQTQKAEEEKILVGALQENQNLSSELKEARATISQQQQIIEKYETLFVRINNTIEDYKEIQSTG